MSDRKAIYGVVALESGVDRDLHPKAISKVTPMHTIVHTRTCGLALLSSFIDAYTGSGSDIRSRGMSFGALYLGRGMSFVVGVSGGTRTRWWRHHMGLLHMPLVQLDTSIYGLAYTALTSCGAALRNYLLSGR